MKLLGRLILLGVGIALLAINIPIIVQLVQSTNWSDPSLFNNNLSLLGNIISRGFACFTAVVALACAMVGKTNFLLALIALIQIGLVIWHVVAGVNDGTIKFDWKIILDLTLSFILPILYFIGTILLSFGRSKN